MGKTSRIITATLLHYAIIMVAIVFSSSAAAQVDMDMAEEELLEFDEEGMPLFDEYDAPLPLDDDADARSRFFEVEGTESDDLILIGSLYFCPTSGSCVRWFGFAHVCVLENYVEPHSYFVWLLGSYFNGLGVYAKEGDDVIEVNREAGVYLDCLEGGIPGRFKVGLWDWSLRQDTLILDGGPGDDVIEGSDFRDYIYGSWGNDEIHSYGNIYFPRFGSEFLYGDESFDPDFPYNPAMDGDDFIEGGYGSSWIYGNGDSPDGDWDDFIWGDSIIPIPWEAGRDFIFAGDGRNFVNAGPGRDYISGGDGDEWLMGGDGNDVIFAHGGNDNLSGCNGSDRVYGGAGSDRIDEQYCQNWPGAYEEQLEDMGDILRGNGTDPEPFEGCDNIIGWLGGDEIHTDGAWILCNDPPYERYDMVDGGPGEDWIYGGWSDVDILEGGEDTDHIYGDVREDWIYGEDGEDFLYGGSGDDYIAGDYWPQGGGYGDEGDDWIEGGSGNDFIEGNGGIDTIFGQGDCDVVYGNEGDDTIYLAYGDDEGSQDDNCTDRNEAHGGEGSDHMYGSDNIDYMWGDGDGDGIEGLMGDDKICSGCEEGTMPTGAGILGSQGSDLLILWVSPGESEEYGVHGGPGPDDIVCYNGCSSTAYAIRLSGDNTGGLSPGDCCDCHGYENCYIDEATCESDTCGDASGDKCNPPDFDCTCHDCVAE